MEINKIIELQTEIANIIHDALDKIFDVKDNNNNWVLGVGQLYEMVRYIGEYIKEND